jgi:GR25 family glycosyltransferase involved in LPS biosynthesis
MVTEQYLTAGYIISQKGVRTLMNHFSSGYGASDWMTTRLQLYGHSYGYFPWVIIQEGKDTNIGSNLEADHEKVLRCLGEIDYGLENYVNDS